MKRERKMVMLSHCILNANSKVEGLSIYPAAMQDLVRFLMESGIGIIQLPCPEMEVYGIKRWGHVKEQFDTPHFRRICREILRSTVGQVENYLNNGYEVLGIIGIDGSPSCGVQKTCSSQNWGGETSDKEELWNKISDVRSVEGRGVFMDELMELLGESGLDIRAFSVDESQLGKSVEGLIEEIKAVQ